MALALTLILCCSGGYGQGHVPYIADLSGAEWLAKHGVDTTDIAGIKHIADSSGHIYNHYAYLFLAQHGNTDIVPSLKKRFYSSLQELWWWRSFYLLGALYALGDPETHAFANALKDTMLAQETENRSRYGGYDYAKVIDVLLAFGDYTCYNFFKSLFARGWRAAAADVRLYYYFAQSSNLQSDVVNQITGLLHDQDAKYRYEAVTVLGWLSNFPGRQGLLREVAMSDGSPEVRTSAIDYLSYDGDFTTAIIASENLAKTTNDSLYFSVAVGRLADINSPYGLAALTRVKASLLPGSFYDEISLALRVYPCTEPPKGASVTVALDTLLAFTDEVSGLGWLSDASFTGELKANLNLARSRLAGSDSVNCGRQLKEFQKKLAIVYEDSLSSSPRKVTIEGWQFLHYNAQYILDRLPMIPPGSDSK